MIWCTVCGNYHSTLLACGGISQFPEPKAKFKTGYAEEINEPTKLIAETIASRDNEWVEWVENNFGELVDEYRAEMWQQRKKELSK